MQAQRNNSIEEAIYSKG